MNYKLGQIIETDKHLERRTIYTSEPFKPDGKQWIETKIKTPKKVMIIGVRTLTNGKRDWTKEGIFYWPTEYIKALLVVENLNRKPFYIPMP